MTPLRVLAFCGLASSGLCAMSGFMNSPILLGVAGTVMTAGNLYALFSKVK